jgi:hypothetical protein
MPDGGDRRSSTRTLPLLALSTIVALASGATCSAESQPASNQASDEGPPKKPGEEKLHVGNPSNTGMDTVPDWNQLATQLKQRVGPRLPDPLPADGGQVCDQMLDAARDFYEATELNPEHKKLRLAELESSREFDKRGCLEQTSIEAASCVTILLAEHSAEFPWLLDQCMRAYPK